MQPFRNYQEILSKIILCSEANVHNSTQKGFLGSNLVTMRHRCRILKQFCLSIQLKNTKMHEAPPTFKNLNIKFFSPITLNSSKRCNSNILYVLQKKKKNPQEDISISNPIFLKAIMYYNQTGSITGIQG